MNYPEYISYFETVAKNHKQIKHSATVKRFYRVNIYDLENSIQTNANFPGLALEKPTWRMTGEGYANKRWSLHGGLLILLVVADQQNALAQDAAEETARQICDDIRAKMIKDRKLYDAGNLDYTIPGLEHDSFSIELIPSPIHGYLYGARLTWVMNEPAAQFDVSKWDDEVDYDV